MAEKYYFAYGSNMNLDQMEERCPDFEFVCVGYIKNYKFVYDGYSITREGAVGNIIKDKEGVVWGAIFKISERDERKLDGYEGYPNTYSKTYLKAYDKQDKPYKVLVYLREALKEGSPSVEYEEIVVESAKQLDLPLEYINTYLKVGKDET